MDVKELQQKLRATYNRESWKEILLDMFPDANFYAHGRSVKKTRKNQREITKDIIKFGEVELEYNTLLFLEVELIPDKVDLTRNKVGLRDLVTSEVSNTDIDGALIVYHGNHQDDWRLTFYSERYELSEDGELVKEQTNPKRYTYELGPNEFCKTASTQLYEVVKLGRNNTLESIIKAFSVQKVSKAFFNEYKHQYDKFVGYLTGEIWKKSGVQKVDTSFTQLNPYFGHATDPKKEARNFAKKLLGRIVFLYFVQKKKWIGSNTPEFKDGDTNFIYNLFHEIREDQRYNFYSQWLSPLFFKTLNKDDDHRFEMPDGKIVYIPFLNGGLFEMDETDARAQGIALPADFFSHSNERAREVPIERGFLDFLSAYNFTIHEDSPDDLTIAVDPEMLGQIFENLLEDNKDKGAYYTPKPIVHYMCQESIIEYLLTSLTDEDTSNEVKEKLRIKLENLVKNHNVGSLSGKTKEILQALQSIKVCDPAIGSGAFPMGMLQEIFQIVDTFQFFESDEFYEGWKLEERKWNPAEIKKQIIQNSIYGVDIEKGAVDIARLRFWLSLIVDEEEPTPLPNLDYKIVVGDSLVSKLVLNGKEKVVKINWEVKESVGKAKEHVENLRQTLDAIVNKQKDFFEADNEAKKKLREEIKKLKIDALIYQLKYDREYYSQNTEVKGGMMPTSADKEHNLTREMQLKEYTKLIEELQKVKSYPEPEFQHFEWKLDFPEILNEQFTDNAGFDVIIANPPYVKEYTHKGAFDGFRDSLYYEGKMDLWYGFACTGIDMLKEKGIECFIAQNNWVTSGGASKMRKKVLSDTKILKLVDFGSYEIFDNASIQTMVMLFQKDDKTDDYRADIYRIEKPNAEFSDVVSLLNEEDSEGLGYLEPKINREFLEGEYLTFSDAQVSDILVKVSENKNFSFDRNEVGTGIDVHQDFVSSKHLEVLGDTAIQGQGIFNLSHEEKEAINWNEEEEELIKPFYTSNELHRYFGEQENKYWVIYTKSSFGAKFSGSKKNPPADLNEYPNIVDHLDQFKEVITSDWKPYGLHRARDEKFFTGEKIISLRKCSDRPTFTYTDFPCYVSQTYFVIKPENIDLKYLTGLLNSRLVMFWLKHKGKMQGNNFQVDKAPIMNIPIHRPETDPGIADLVDQILTQKEANPEADTTALEQQIDTLVYKLYNLTWEEVKVVDPVFDMSKEEYEELEIEKI